MKRPESHLPLIVSFALAGVVTASLATGTAQSAVASLVQIVNTSVNPVPTQDVDHPARQPVSFVTSITIAANAPNGFNFQAYQVPAGKRLVVEHISFLDSLPNPEQVFALGISEAGQDNAVYVPVSNLGSLVNVPNFHWAVTSQPVTLYASAGDNIQVGIYTDGTATSPRTISVNWTGYLVNLP